VVCQAAWWLALAVHDSAVNVARTDLSTGAWLSRSSGRKGMKFAPGFVLAFE
jgi:hypothetical protein